MRCSTCNHHDLVTIHLTIATESVDMHRCPRCDSRQWTDARGEISRDGVLELVRTGR